MGDDGDTLSTEVVGDGGTLPQPEDLIRNGSVFGGWYLESDTNFTEPYNFNTPVTNPITLCAKWNGAIFNIADLGAYLSKWSANDADNPYIVSLKVNDISTLRATLNDNPDKYVNLDLSGSNIETIPANAFYGSAGTHGCATLTGIIIPDGVITIEQSAFIECTSLTSATIPNSVTTIVGSIFGRCTSLTAINVDAGNSNYSSQDGVLYNKDKTILVAYPSATGSITISGSVTTIWDRAFMGCTNLADITIPNSVTTIEFAAFVECTGLSYITIPNSVTTIGQNAFTQCTGLTSVTIGNSVTSIGQSAFAACIKLDDVTFTSTSQVTTIGQGAFYGCTSLASVTIPNSVTTIGQEAFSQCTKLTSVTFATGSNITNANFGNGAFPQENNGMGGNTLKTAYNTGKAGTYTRQEDGTTWAKSP
jgi:hypothetical protein